MANMSAVQMLININGKSLTLYNNKKNVVSLKVSRVMGDASNKFTLELFDETAWKLESALYGTKNASISIQYGATGDWASGKRITFTGICVTYNLNFVGAATILHIEGIVHSASSIEGSNSASFWFKKDTIQWVDTTVSSNLDRNYDDVAYRQSCAVDGKWRTKGGGPNGEGDQGYEDTDEKGNYADYICAIVQWIPPEATGTGHWGQRVLVNPTNIFKRIIRKYNGEIGNTLKDVDNKAYKDSGVGHFKLGEVDDSLWVNAECINLTQTNQTAADFINTNLCNCAIKPGSKSAGFKYYINSKGEHCFKAIDYSSSSASKVVKTGYYVKDSDVVSFSLNSIGAIVMAGSDTDENGNPLVDVSSFDSLSGEMIESNLWEYGNNYKSEELMDDDERATSTNWYFKTVSSVKVVSSSSKELLDIEFGNQFEKLKTFTMSATLTIWGEYNNKYIPGNYIDLTVMTPDGKQHYGTGKYFIISSEDSVTHDGYTTTMKLLKNTDRNRDTSGFKVGTQQIKPGEYVGNVNPYSDNTDTFQYQAAFSEELDAQINEMYAYAVSLMAAPPYNWTSETEYESLYQMWMKESSWNPRAENKSSGAYGIPQANPSGGQTITDEYRKSWKVQIKWGLDYIKNRYGTPAKAWSFWQQHHWY